METQKDISLQLTVDTQLINDWQNVSPFKSNGQVVAVQGPDGTIQVFTTGTDGNIYNIFRDANTPTGWNCLNIHYPDNATNSVIAVGQDLDNNIVIVAATLDTQWSRYWFYKNQSWGNGWKRINDQFADAGKGYSTIQSIQFYRGLTGLLCMTNGGVSDEYDPSAAPSNIATFIVNMTNFSITTPSSYYPSLTVKNFYTSSDANIQIIVDIPYDDNITSISMGVLNGSGEGVFAISSNLVLYFYPVQMGSNNDLGSEEYILTSTYFCTSLATVINSEGYSEIFLSSSNGLSYINQGSNSSFLINSLSESLEGITFSNLNPSFNIADELEIFALGSDNNLYHCYFSTSNEQWTTLTPIIASISAFDVVKNSENYSEIFAISTDNILYNIFQGSNIDSGIGWQVNIIDFPSSTSVEPFLLPTYSTLVTVTDAITNRPLVQESFTIYASDLLEIQINGTYGSIDSENGKLCQTDSTGKLTINYIANSLNTPMLRICSSLLNIDTDLFIDPSENAKSIISSMTVDELQIAATPDLSCIGIQSISLLSSTYQTDENAKNVQLTFQQLLNFQPTQLSRLEKTAKFLNRGKAKHGIYLGKADLRTIKHNNSESVENQYWQLKFLPKFSFEKLDREMAEQRINDLNQTAIASVFSSWDDIWSGVQNASIELTSWICSGVQTIINYVVDGVNYMYNQVIETFDQAINALEGLFGYFGSKTKDWLTYLGNLLNWDDIMNTSQNLQPLILEPFSIIQSQLNTNSVSINNYFENQRQNIIDFFNDINNYLNSSVTINSVQAYNNQTLNSFNYSGLLESQTADDESLSFIEYFDPSVTSNWLFSKIMENISDQSNNIFSTIPNNLNDLTSSISAFFSTIENSQVGADVQNLITQIQDFYTSITSDSNLWEQQTIAAALGILEQITLVMLDTIDIIAGLLVQLANAIIDSLQSVLTAEINIPVVSWLYKNFISNGENLTMVNLFSLLVAVPTTISYKLANNNTPPFPSNLINRAAYQNNIITPSIPAEVRVWITVGALSVFFIHDLITEGQAVDFWMGLKQVSQQVEQAQEEKQSFLKAYLLFGTTVPILLPLALTVPNFSSSTGFDRASSALWCIRLTPSLTNYIHFLLFEKGAKSSYPGICCLALTGIASLAAGITKSVYASHSSNQKDSTVTQYLKDTIPSIPLILKSLYPAVKPTPPGLAVALALITATSFSGIANPILTLVQYNNSEL